MSKLKAIDVADYIRSRFHVLGETQLQKLVYYSQCWSLAWDGEPLFDDEIQAWRNGPVVPALRHSLECCPSGTSIESENARATIDAVLEFYGSMNGKELSKLSHEQRPWLEARGDLPETQASSRAIAPQIMCEWASDEVLVGNAVPTREALRRREADVGQVARLAKVAVNSWGRTLERLAA